VNNGLFDISCIQTTPTSTINAGVSSNNVLDTLSLSQNRGVGINYDNLVFLIDTRLESDYIFSFSLGSTVDVFVDWGDGTRETFKTTGTKSHTYPSKGRYVVQVGGTLNTITFASMTGRGKLVSCLSFGNLSKLTTCTFNGCSNLIGVPNQIPRTFTSLNSMFTSCTNFNDNNISFWDTSNITDMSTTFQAASSFSRPLNSWNTKKVTTMSNMFYQCNYNQTIGSWDVGKVTNFTNMFGQQFTAAKAFNQDINQWNVSSATNMNQMFFANRAMTYDLNSWDTSKVTNMGSMFYQSVFNGNISNWNISAATTVSSMFFQVSAFNRDISSWNFKGLNATANFDSFMTSATGFSTTNYNALLIAMNNNKSSAPYRSDLRPTFAATYYGSSSAAATARAALVTYGWTITDGGTTTAAPDAPTSVAGTAGNAQVSLTWTAPTYNNGAAISDYTIQYSSNSGSSWTTFSHSASATASITVTGLTNSTAYIFRVAAVNSAGTGSYSSNSSSITPVAASFSPVAYVITSGTSRTVPTGATSMKAWVIGGGGGGTEGTNCNSTSECDGGYGGEAVKTYTVVGGNTVTYTIGTGGAGGSGGGAAVNGGNSTLTYGGVTVTGGGGTRGDSGTCGLPYGTGSGGDFNHSLGASTPYPADYQGRSAAVTLAGTSLAANVGKGGLGQVMDVGLPGGAGAIVLYFT